MSTKTTTTQNQNTSQQWQNQYFPAGLTNYRQFQGTAGPYITGQIQSPFSNPFYQFGLQQSVRGASQQGANNMNVLNQLMRTSGIGGSAGQGFQAAQLAQMGRANSGLFANAKIQNILGALQRQQGLSQFALGYQPMAYGGTSAGQMSGQSTQSTSGTGTWLPQLMSGAMNAAMAFGTGGASLAASPGVGAGALGYGGMGGSLGGASMNPMQGVDWSSIAAGPSAAPNPYMVLGGFGGPQ